MNRVVEIVIPEGIKTRTTILHALEQVRSLWLVLRDDQNIAVPRGPPGVSVISAMICGCDASKIC